MSIKSELEEEWEWQQQHPIEHLNRRINEIETMVSKIDSAGVGSFIETKIPNELYIAYWRGCGRLEEDYKNYPYGKVICDPKDTVITKAFHKYYNAEKWIKEMDEKHNII